MPDAARCILLVRGIVQGVGFRPFVYRTAVGLGLAGSVANTPEGVSIDLEGPRDAIARFAGLLRTAAPPLARVESVAERWGEPAGADGFVIAASGPAGGATTLIPPDVATCDACLRELRDPSDRRYRYPFINCTDCGPRFTIIEGVPYDRARTTMRVFPMCPACAAEYADPGTRRFHAEPDACGACGPRVRLAGADARDLDAADPIAGAARLLEAGRVVAVKGMGGFHLACDAADDTAVLRLRRAKQRDGKPFAVMVAGLDALGGIARLRPGEADLLASPARPIVLVDKAEPFPLAPSIAPGIAQVGVLLAYTPLHHLLLDACAGRALVMTSANPHDEPIVRDDDEAADRLAGIAEAYLFHDRPILARADDSVALVARGRPRLVRRSRGYTPLPVTLPRGGPPVLACGGDLKNAFCVTRGDEAFLGPHVGDLENAAAAAYFEEAAAHMCRLLEVRPAVVVHDLHPDYASTRLARRLRERLFPEARLVAVQHHHAHALSCLAENGHAGPAIAVTLDGTGYGTDRTIWGAEVLRVDGASFRREARLGTLPLPGGDRAVREPWRIAVALLVEAGLADRVGALSAAWPSAAPGTLAALARLAEAGHPFPRSGGLGRLFDAVAALAGVRDVATWEGEAAVALEHAARAHAGPAEPYPLPVVPVDGVGTVDPLPLVRAVVADVLDGVPASRVSARFHAAVASTWAGLAGQAAAREGLGTVALSGGAFANRILLDGLSDALESAGLQVLLHAAVPANDGGLALGQAAIALAEPAPTA